MSPDVKIHENVDVSYVEIAPDGSDVSLPEKLWCLLLNYDIFANFICLLMFESERIM